MLYAMCKKINNNIVGFKIDDYVYDVINKKLYQIISEVINLSNIDGGYFSKHKKHCDLHERNYRGNNSDQIYVNLSTSKSKIIKLLSRKF